MYLIRGLGSHVAVPALLVTFQSCRLKCCIVTENKKSPPELNDVCCRSSLFCLQWVISFVLHLYTFLLGCAHTFPLINIKAKFAVQCGRVVKWKE